MSLTKSSEVTRSGRGRPSERKNRKARQSLHEVQHPFPIYSLLIGQKRIKNPSYLIINMNYISDWIDYSLIIKNDE